MQLQINQQPQPAISSSVYLSSATTQT